MILNIQRRLELQVHYTFYPLVEQYELPVDIYESSRCKQTENNFKMAQAAFLLFGNGSVDSRNHTSNISLTNGSAPCLDYYKATNYMMDFRINMFATFLYLGIFVCVFGIFGNALSIVVLWKVRESQRVHTFLLQALAVGDTVFHITFLVFSIIEYQDIGGRSETLVYAKVHANHVMQLAQVIDTWLVMPLTMVRYVRVCHPFKANRFCSMTRAKQLVGAATVVAIVICIPKFMEAYVGPIQGYCTLIYTAWYNNKLFGFHGMLTYKIVYYVFSYVVPLALLFVFNLRLVGALRSSRVTHVQTRLAGDDHQTNKRANVVVIVIISVFIICQTPFFLGELLYMYGHRLDIKGLFNYPMSYNFMIFRILYFLRVINSSINFIIYCALGQHFRSIVLDLICRRRSKNENRLYYCKTETTEFNSKITESCV